MIIYRASLETSHFSFEAYGATRSEAYNAMRAGMEKHARQVGIAPDSFTSDFWQSVEVYPVLLGAAYRDRGEL